ncbi:phosphatidate cytidylyltransferase [Thiorhodococcus mannitoliphagus]|nr:phosphatidate cytidylyltransferase [Thiorhodococcus mannitoliphagus]
MALASSSLRRRAITAFSLGPLVIAAVLFLPTSAFGLFFLLVLLLAAWEWGSLSGITKAEHRLGYLGLVGLCVGILWLFPSLQGPSLVLGSLWWLFQAVQILMTRKIDLIEGPRALQLVAGLLVLLPPWAAVMQLHRAPDVGPGLVLFLLILIWTADTAAYFVGRRWGRAKLAPAVSPGKTRVGVYGALVGAAVCGLGLAWALGLDGRHTLLALIICAAAALISVVGDLYESLLKRQRSMKDSSQLLPGHGGLLDRIDSLTAAAPVFALGVVWALT